MYVFICAYIYMCIYMYVYMYVYIHIYQCSKLKVHSAPGVHISEAGRTFFGCVRPLGAHFFTQFSLQYTRGVHRKTPERTVSICVHPRGTQNKTLISNNVYICIDIYVYIEEPLSRSNKGFQKIAKFRW